MTLSPSRTPARWTSILVLLLASLAQGETWMFTQPSSPTVDSLPSKPLAPSGSSDAPIGAQVVRLPAPPAPAPSVTPPPIIQQVAAAIPDPQRQSSFTSPPTLGDSSYGMTPAQAGAYWGDVRTATAPAGHSPYDQIQYNHPPVTTGGAPPNSELQLRVADPPPSSSGAGSTTLQDQPLSATYPPSPSAPVAWASPNTPLPMLGGRLPDRQPTGFIFRWDRLLTSFNAPSVSSPGSASTPIGTSNGIPFSQQFSLGGDFLDERPRVGDRLEFGFVDRDFDGTMGSGWIISVLLLDQTKSSILNGRGLLLNDPLGLTLGFQDSNGDGFDDDIDLDSIFGRDGVDQGTPVFDPISGTTSYVPPSDGIPDAPSAQDDGDLVTWVPVFDAINVRNTIDMSGSGLSRIRNVGRWGNNTSVNWMYGVRHLDIDERFVLSARNGGFVSALDINTRVQNFAIGPEIGFILDRRNGPSGLSGSLRFAPTANFQRGSQVASLTANGPNPGAVNQPLNLASVQSTTFETTTQFSPILEWRVDTSYDLARWMTVRAGYTGWFVGGMTRAGNSAEYSLPNFGFDLSNNDHILAHALTLGLELNF